MELSTTAYLLILFVFVVGYIAIIGEHSLKINKSAAALFVGVLCWALFFITSPHSLEADLSVFAHHLSGISQIIFFLLGAMALVELIDSHRGFKIVTDLIQTSSKRKLLWIISLSSFFLSAVLDNLTTTILMISLLRKLIPQRSDRFLAGCLVVIAANAGGAWTPIGDVTTTMLWIGGQLSSFPVMKSLFIPSLISLLVPLLLYTWKEKGRYKGVDLKEFHEQKPEPGARLVFGLGLAGLIFVPIFKGLTGLPPFMGILISLAVLWLVTDFLHQKVETRRHLTVPVILTRIDTPGILFFLGILLSVSALDTAGILGDLATLLNDKVGNINIIALLIGLFSAIVDNVPLVAATMGMYSLQTFPMDDTLWHMIAYAAGTGGSILIIGSAAGVAFMGLEKVDFISFVKKASFPALCGYLAGFGTYLLLQYL